jgi:hypothetical protein
LRSADTCFAHLHTGRSEPDRTIEGRSTEPHWAFQRRSNAVRRVLNVTAARYSHFHTCRLKLGLTPVRRE